MFKAYDVLDMVLEMYMFDNGNSVVVDKGILSKIERVCGLVDELSEEVEGSSYQAGVVGSSGISLILECDAPPVFTEKDTLSDILNECSGFKIEQDGEGNTIHLVFLFDGLLKERGQE